MASKKRILPVVLALAFLAVAALFWWRWRNRDDSDRIRLSGNIELQQVDISFKIAGRLVERLVDEGDPVQAGAVVARLDAAQIQSARDRERAALLAAQTQLAQLETAIAFQRSTLAAETQLRKAELQQAEAKLQELLAGAREQEIRQAKAAVEDVRTQHEQARSDWERAQALYKNEDISTAQYEQYRTRFNSTAALLKQAEERLALVLEGPRKEDIEAGRAQVARARAAIQLVEAGQLDLKRRQQELATRRADIERARAQLAIAESQLADTVAVSPISGYVLAKSAEAGEVLAAGTTVVSVGDLDHPWLRAYINARDLGRVKLGTKARITSEAFPGREYWGRVSFISSEAEFTPKQIQTQEERVKLVYRIKIEVENPRHELKSNMPVDAELLLGRP